MSNQYFPCRVEGVFTIGFPSDQAGAPRFYDAAGNYSSVVTFTERVRKDNNAEKENPEK